MARNCPQRTGQRQNYTSWTNACTTEVVDNRDDLLEVGTKALVSTQGIKVNNVQLGSDMMIQALESMAKEQREEFFDRMLQKNF